MSQSAPSIPPETEIAALKAAKGSKKSFYLRLGGTALTLALLGWLLYQQGWQEIVKAVQMIPAWLLALALAITLLSRVAVGLRWHALLAASGEKVALPQSLRITFAGLFASNYLPTTIGGDVVRLAGAAQLGMDTARSAASLVLDRLVGMAGMATVLPWGLVPFLQSGLKITAGGGLAAFAGAPPRVGRFSKLRGLFMRGFGKFWNALVSGARHPKALLASYAFTWIYMICRFTAIWLMLQGMGQPMPWMLIAGVWSLVYFVTLMPVSINGYGLQEVSVTLLYTHLGGISAEGSLAIALLMRTMDTLASLPGALFVPGILAASRAVQPNTPSPSSTGSNPGPVGK